MTVYFFLIYTQKKIDKIFILLYTTTGKNYKKKITTLRGCFNLYLGFVLFTSK